MGHGEAGTPTRKLTTQFKFNTDLYTVFKVFKIYYIYIFQINAVIIEGYVAFYE